MFGPVIYSIPNGSFYAVRFCIAFHIRHVVYFPKFLFWCIIFTLFTLKVHKHNKHLKPRIKKIIDVSLVPWIAFMKSCFPLMWPLMSIFFVFVKCSSPLKKLFEGHFSFNFLLMLKKTHARQVRQTRV